VNLLEYAFERAVVVALAAKRALRRPSGVVVDREWRSRRSTPEKGSRDHVCAKSVSCGEATARAGRAKTPPHTHTHIQT
jgi:hypothetical protein